MKHAGRFLGVLFAGIVMLVLLPGMGRLFKEATPQTPVIPKAGTPAPLLYEGMFLQSKSTTTADKATDATSRYDGEKERCAVLHNVSGQRANRRHDANGNVVTAGAYYQCVAEAFAAGDAKT